MARPSPSARVDSKNTVSPIAIAVTIESASSPRAPVDAAANAPTPAVAVTQPSRSAPPTVARAALTTTEPSPGTSERARSEEHTSELQSPDQLVCRLLLEKKTVSFYECKCNNNQ